MEDRVVVVTLNFHLNSFKIFLSFCLSPHVYVLSIDWSKHEFKSGFFKDMNTSAHSEFDTPIRKTWYRVYSAIP